MSLTSTLFDKAGLDKAGRILIDDSEDFGAWLESVKMVNEWRTLHRVPLQTFRTNLRKRVDKRGIVAQRLKRLTSIMSKLERLDWLLLSEMQDIGGCRAVVKERIRLLTSRQTLPLVAFGTNWCATRITLRAHALPAIEGFTWCILIGPTVRVGSLGRDSTSRFRLGLSASINGQLPSKRWGHSLETASSLASVTNTGCASLL